MLRVADFFMATPIRSNRSAVRNGDIVNALVCRAGYIQPSLNNLDTVQVCVDGVT